MEEGQDLSPILEDALSHRTSLRDLREMLLANVIMIGEIPSPTFGEDEVVRFLGDRFTEAGLQDVSWDEIGNATALVPGKSGKHHILVTAHVDTLWGGEVDHTVGVNESRLTGPGIADNALGVAALATLPHLLDALDVRLESDLVLLGSTRSLGKGDIEGIRFFLNGTDIKLDAGLCIEGIQVGRLSYSSLGLLRGEISLTVPEVSEADTADRAGAIGAIQQVVAGMLAIERPQRPRTELILGSLEAGSGFAVPPTTATLRFEVRSEDAAVVNRISRRIEEIVEEVDAIEDVDASLSVLARHEPGNIGFSHPYVAAARDIMESLDIEPRIQPSISELSALLDEGIPALTLGVTRGSNRHTLGESIEIDPLFDGLSQLIATLRAMDHHLSSTQ